MQRLFSQIKDDFKLICSMPIRQQATVGGNLVNASPIGDISVFFLALDATLIFIGNKERRSLPLRHFFKAYKQIDLQAEEQLTEISFFCPERPLKFSFEKVSKRTYLDIASVNSAMLIELQGSCIKTIHISAGGVAAHHSICRKPVNFCKQKQSPALQSNRLLILPRQKLVPLPIFEAP